MGSRFGLTFAKCGPPTGRPSSSKRGPRREGRSQIFGPGGAILVMVVTIVKSQEGRTSARASLWDVLTAEKFSRLCVWEAILGSRFGLTFAKCAPPTGRTSPSKRGPRREGRSQIFGSGGPILVMTATIMKSQERTTSARAALRAHISLINDQTVVVAVWGTTTKVPCTGIYGPRFWRATEFPQ